MFYPVQAFCLMLPPIFDGIFFFALNERVPPLSVFGAHSFAFQNAILKLFDVQHFFVSGLTREGVPSGRPFNSLKPGPSVSHLLSLAQALYFISTLLFFLKNLYEY